VKLRHGLFLGFSGAAIAASLPAACIATSPTGIHRQTDQDDGGGGSDFDPGDGGPATTTFDPGNDDPHKTVGCEPAHGPFLGGQRVLVREKASARTCASGSATQRRTRRAQ
jgi:hypothetical protein